MASPRTARRAPAAAAVGACLVAWLLTSGVVVVDAARNLKDSSPPPSPAPPLTSFSGKSASPAAVADGSSSRVQVQAPFVNVDVDTKSGGGCVVIPGVGRLGWLDGCRRRQLLAAAVADASAGVISATADVQPAGGQGAASAATQAPGSSSSTPDTVAPAPVLAPAAAPSAAVLA
ncbi:hypothetical protein CHLRE_04g215200v5 [Chlamydomonas reinhardtii]|uniref:Uncharacterized protein n=1 Tax=Chlamydomonas reinhardtii TaxID=3055 RepID=A0A2K3DTS2_CHLRE|nr:uncharacterized protein CHLRE_04g215200v5 [Chlamydomonas reinhardtii]PNW83925.1 hypothetical protein CHLRE_04g215200v5 [Chlamydomonas reinhardtii]